MVALAENSAIMRRRKVRSRKEKSAAKATLTLKVPKLGKQRVRSELLLIMDIGGVSTHKKMKVTMNQEAKKIPTALLNSAAGVLA